MFKALTRRAATVGVASVAILGLATGPAAAHFCFKTELQEQAAEGMAGSAGWMSFQDVAMSFLPGMCVEGAQILAAAGGVELDTMINVRGTMAAGTLKKEQPGNKAISHLDFAALDAAIPTAYRDGCGMEPPPPPAE